MKLAIVHDYLKEIGGAERVLMALKEIWPEAPVYTAYAFSKYWGEYTEVMNKWDIRQSWGRYLPFKEKFLSYYTALSPFFFRNLDLSEYDVVIVSQTGGYFPNGVRVGKKTILITYCHTPPRFLYGYPTASQERYRWYWRIQSELVNHVLRVVDYKFAQRPNYFIANSNNVVQRIRKFYRREAVVVYPPIENSKLEIRNSKRDYFVMVSRIVGSKNIHLAIEAADRYGFRLKVAGRPAGKYGNTILQLIKQSKNSEYLGEVTDVQKAKLYQEAKAALVLEEEPDFGMVAIEPQMYGTPVIAYKNGGYVESVVEGKTGIFIEQLTVENIGEAVLKIPKVQIQNTHKIVEKFSKARFKKEMLQLVKSYAGTS